MTDDVASEQESPTCDSFVLRDALRRCHAALYRIDIAKPDVPAQREWADTIKQAEEALSTRPCEFAMVHLVLEDEVKCGLELRRTSCNDGVTCPDCLKWVTRARRCAATAKQATRVNVNGVEKDVESSHLSYEDIVRLAWGVENAIMTVTWSIRGGPGGSLVPGQSIAVVAGMALNAYDTGSA